MAGHAIAVFEMASQVASRAEEIWERIAGLSDLMAAAKKTLVELGEDDNHHTELRRANLQTTIMTVQRELVLARQSLQGARELEAAAETLASLKTRSRAQQALDRTIPPDTVKAILTSATARARHRRARSKKSRSDPEVGE
jgi:hypothetical protein